MLFAAFESWRQRADVRALSRRLFTRAEKRKQAAES